MNVLTTAVFVRAVGTVWNSVTLTSDLDAAAVITRELTWRARRAVCNQASTTDVINDFVFKTKAKAIAFEAKAKDLQKARAKPRPRRRT